MSFNESLHAPSLQAVTSCRKMQSRKSKLNHTFLKKRYRAEEEENKSESSKSDLGDIEEADEEDAEHDTEMQPEGYKRQRVEESDLLNIPPSSNVHIKFSNCTFIVNDNAARRQ